MKTFFSKVKTVGLDDGDFLEDDNATGLWDFLDSKVLLLILCLKLTNIYNFFTTFSKIWIKKYIHIYIIELKK